MTTAEWPLPSDVPRSYASWRVGLDALDQVLPSDATACSWGDGPIPGRTPEETVAQVMAAGDQARLMRGIDLERLGRHVGEVRKLEVGRKRQTIPCVWVYCDANAGGSHTCPDGGLPYMGQPCVCVTGPPHVHLRSGIRWMA